MRASLMRHGIGRFSNGSAFSFGLKRYGIVPMNTASHTKSENFIGKVIIKDN